MQVAIGNVLEHLQGVLDKHDASQQKIRFTDDRGRCVLEVFWDHNRGLVIYSPDGGRLSVWPEVANTINVRTER